MLRSHSAWLWVLMLLILVFPASADTLKQVLATPASERVYDSAKVLQKSDRARLRDLLLRMEKSGAGGGSIVVVQRVEGESIESFAKRLGNKRGFGANPKKRFVIVAAITQRRWRFETNRALRASIPDDAAKALMQKHLVPAFRRKQYRQGLEAALKAIDAASRKPAAVKSAASYPARSVPVSSAGFKDDRATSGLGALVVVMGGMMLAGLLMVLFFAGVQTASTGGFSGMTHHCNEDAFLPHHFSDAGGSGGGGQDGSCGSGGDNAAGSGGDGGGGASGEW